MHKTLHSPQHQRLVAWLKKARCDQGLTMRDLAVKLGVPHSFVGKVEQGERRLDLVEFIQYCECLGLKPEDGIKVVRGPLG
ncbi:helix-turn-helix domain-containing protein [Idiomarina baltica]|uniref:DNA binding protein n=1 Tax=Idiomarina baltica OS145 TaxID=314276 RepID=A0ABM9WNN5_9GAMM|nr:helix-turn-helix transcriptional regulator [Idiomarina baltica]EAQ32564.1 putative DNA binding protein [Idiomarina baltica OS145]